MERARRAGGVLTTYNLLVALWVPALLASLRSSFR
jgi:hypothetical protein